MATWFRLASGRGMATKIRESVVTLHRLWKSIAGSSSLFRPEIDHTPCREILLFINTRKSRAWPIRASCSRHLIEPRSQFHRGSPSPHHLRPPRLHTAHSLLVPPEPGAGHNEHPTMNLPPFGAFRPLCRSVPSYPICNLFTRQVCLI